MKRIVALLLLLALCLGLCACDKDTSTQDNNKENVNMGNSNSNTDGNTQDENLPQVSAEFLSLVCGKWKQAKAGWYDLGATLEFREDNTCTFGEEELTWDAAFKPKPWLDEPVEFVNIYRNGTFVYEAQLLTVEDGAIVMQISQRDDENIGVPVDYYNKADTK